jgi:hypothetical protein
MRADPEIVPRLGRGRARKVMSGGPGNLSYTPLEYIKIGQPVDRISYISRACMNKVVLDLGALDETAFAEKRGRGSWLH